ncbi:DUF2441 domain-containing protein [Methylobacterium crusticola]|nr:DUF2441 domain-containing protein [Methylobacterium crusticola]
MIGISGASHFHFAREQILETARRSRYSEKPSRLRCIFACRNEQDVRRYVDEQVARHPGRIREPLYEVETTDPRPLMHHGDWAVAELVMGGGPEAEVAADRYWQGVQGPARPEAPGTFMEVITTSPLLVLRRLA